MTSRLLVVDDSAAIPKVIRIAFSKYRIEVNSASTYAEAAAELKRQPVDLLIVDAGMFGDRLLDELANLRRHAGKAPVILLAGSYEDVNGEDLRRAGYDHVLRKPFESNDIVELAQRLLGGRLEAQAHSGESQVVPPPPPPVGAFGASTPGSPLGAPPPPPMARPRSEDLAPPPPPPQIPLNDAKRVGQKAFTADMSQPPREPAFPPESTGTSGRRAPVEFSLEEEDWFSPPPPPPLGREPNVALEEESDLPPPPPPPPRGRQRDFEFSSEEPETKISGLRPSAAEVSSPGARPAADLRGREGNEVVSRQELAILVRQAVEDYCSRHFSALAREIITAEIRRLTEERSRHLVDN